MLIEDIRLREDNDLIIVGPDDTVADAMKALAENNIGALPVCDDTEKLLGILSERDIVREISRQGTGLIDQKISQVMTKEVFTCKPEDDTNDVMEVMQANRFRHIPVVVDGHVTRMISTRDLMGAVLDEVSEQRSSLAVAYELVR